MTCGTRSAVRNPILADPAGWSPVHLNRAGATLLGYFTAFPAPQHRLTAPEWRAEMADRFAVWQKVTATCVLKHEQPQWDYIAAYSKPATPPILSINGPVPVTRQCRIVEYRDQRLSFFACRLAPAAILDASNFFLPGDLRV